jgi:hypothetical protein
MPFPFTIPGMPHDSDLPRPLASHRPWPPEVPPVKVLTRTHVARMLRCALVTVRRMEQDGRLQPIVDPRGVRRFDRRQVEALCRERLRQGFRAGGITGELAAEVFSHFRNQVPFADIVIKTHASPETIRVLWDEYKRPLGAPSAQESARALQQENEEAEARSRDIEHAILQNRARRAVG